MSIKYSAVEIANKIAAVDPTFRIPTDEQIPIIQAPLAPAVVIAGAKLMILDRKSTRLNSSH